MQPGRILLCAVVADGRAPGLVAVARRWADATSTRPLFVHVRPRPVAAAPAGQSINAGSGDGPVPKPLAALGIAEHELHAVSGRPAGALLDIIGELHPWLIVVASSSHGGRETVKVGHVCAALVRHSPSPVLVMPPGADAAPSGGPIACAISFGDEDEAAVRFAVSLAIATNRGLALAHVLGVREAARLAASRARDSVLGSPPAGFDTDSWWMCTRMPARRPRPERPVTRA